MAQLERAVPAGNRRNYEMLLDIDYYEGDAPANCVDAAFVAEHGFLGRGLRGPANGDRCKLDIYRPVAAAPAAVIFFMHPGGLRFFQKYIPGAFKERGLVIVSINYRYSGMGS